MGKVKNGVNLKRRYFPETTYFKWLYLLEIKYISFVSIRFTGASTTHEYNYIMKFLNR